MTRFDWKTWLMAWVTGGLLSSAATAQIEEKTAGGNKPAPIPVSTLNRTTPVEFEKEILPILKNNCLACHNQTKAKAELILETPQTILKGGESGPAVVPGRSAGSLLLEVASHRKQDTIMPPPKNNVAASDLTPDELGLIKLWIDQGAKGVVSRKAEPIEWQPLPPGLNPIYAVAVTPDGQFAACGRANQIFVYHIPSRRLATRLTDPLFQKDNPRANAGMAHRDLVHALAFSPDGNLLASGGYREVKLWRRPGDVQKFNFAAAARKGVQAIAVSPDGKWLATGGADGSVKLWDLARGKLAKKLPSHRGAVNFLAFSPDNTRLLSGSKDQTMRVWNVSESKRIAQTHAGAEINAGVWLAGNGLVASGSRDGIIRIWQLSPGIKDGMTSIKEIKGHSGAVTSLESVPRVDRQLLSGGEDGSLRLWDIETGQVVREMKHGGPIAAVAVRGDGKRFASAGLNHVAKLWDSEKGHQVAEIKGERHTFEAVANRERALTFATNEVAYYRTALKAAETNRTAQAERIKKATAATETVEKTFAEKQKGLKEATDAKLAAEKALAEVDAEVKKSTEALEAVEKTARQAEADVKAAKETIPPDKTTKEKTVAEADAKVRVAGEAKVAAEKLVTETKEKQKKAADKVKDSAKALENADKEFKKAELAKSNAENELQLAVKSEQKAADAVSGAQYTLENAQENHKRAETGLEAAQKATVEFERPIRAVAFSADNRVLATAGDDWAVHTWSADDGAAFETFKGHQSAVYSLAFTPDGGLVSGAADRSAIVWDTNPAWTLDRVIGTGDTSSPLIDRVNAVRFSADGEQLATGGGEPTRGGEIKIWQIPSGRLIQSLTNVHSDAVLGLDYSPDGKYLASCAADKFIKVSDLATGKTVRSFEGHTHHVLGVSWKRDGRTLVSCGADNVIKIWDFITGERKKNIEGFGKEVTSISYIGFTDQAVATSGDNQVRAVNEKGENVRTFSGGTDYMFSSAVTLDGKVVIAGGQDSVLRIWDGSNGQTLTDFSPPGP